MCNYILEKNISWLFTVVKIHLNLLTCIFSVLRHIAKERHADTFGIFRFLVFSWLQCMKDSSLIIQVRRVFLT